MLNALYDRYKDRVEFYVVYIKEAHATDVWSLGVNDRSEVIAADPKSFAERVAVAGTCATRLGVRIPALIDDMENSTEVSYSAWPERLYLIDHEGRVKYKGDPGPFGFSPAELEQQLKEIAP